jgi:hypothetical protein
MRKTILLSAALTLGAPSATASAAPSRWYAGVDVGNTHIRGYSAHKTSLGMYGGFAFTPYVGTELEYRRLAADDTAALDQLALSVVGTLPIGSDYFLFGRAGYSRLRVTADAFGFDASKGYALAGIGAGLMIDAGTSLRAELQRPGKDVTNFNVALSFKF